MCLLAPSSIWNDQNAEADALNRKMAHSYSQDIIHAWLQCRANAENPKAQSLPKLYQEPFGFQSFQIGHKPQPSKADIITLYKLHKEHLVFMSALPERQYMIPWDENALKETSLRNKSVNSSNNTIFKSNLFILASLGGGGLIKKIIKKITMSKLCHRRSWCSTHTVHPGLSVTGEEFDVCSDTLGQHSLHLPSQSLLFYRPGVHTVLMFIPGHFSYMVHRSEQS